MVGRRGYLRLRVGAQPVCRREDQLDALVGEGLGCAAVRLVPASLSAKSCRANLQMRKPALPHLVSKALLSTSPGVRYSLRPVSYQPASQRTVRGARGSS